MEALHIIKQAFLHISHNMMDWIKAGLAPMVVAMIVGVISHYSMGDLKPEDMTFMTTVYAIAMSLLSGFFGAMAMMQMYRFGIMGEKPTGWINMRFNKNLLRFVMYYVLFGLIVGVIAGMLIMPVILLGGFLQNMLISTFAGTLAALAVAYVFVKFILMIPAAAVKSEYPIKMALNLSKGHVFMMLLVVIAFIMVALGIGKLNIEFMNLISSTGFMMNMVLQLFSFAMSMIGSIIAAAGLCTLYNHLLAKAE